MTETELPQVLQLLTRFDDVVDAASSTEVLTNLTRLVSETQPEEASQRAKIAAVIQQIPNSIHLAEGGAVQALQQALETKRQERPDEGEALLSGQFRLARELPPEEAAGVSRALESFIGNGAPEEISRLAKKEAEATAEVVPAGAWYGPLRSRLSRNPNEDDAKLLMGSLLDLGRLRDERETAVDSLATCLGESAEPGWQTTLRAASEVLRPRIHLTRPVADRPYVEKLINAVLRGARANPQAAVPDAITLILALLEEWKCSHGAVLQQVETFLDANTEEGARLATELLTKGMERMVFSDAALGDAMDSLVNRLNRTVPGSPNQVGLLFDCLMMMGGRLSRRGDAFVVIRGYSRPNHARPSHVPEDYRSLAYEKVGRFKKLPRGKEKIHLDQLLDEARSAGEPLRSEILKCLAALRAVGIARRSAVWREANAFVSTAGPEYDWFAEQL